MSAGEQGRMYTANIVDTVVFRSLGKHPNPHLDRLKNAVEEAQTEIWVPDLIYEELADHGPDGTVTNPYLDHGIEEGWIRVVSPPQPDDGIGNADKGHILRERGRRRITFSTATASTQRRTTGETGR